MNKREATVCVATLAFFCLALLFFYKCNIFYQKIFRLDEKQVDSILGIHSNIKNIVLKCQKIIDCDLKSGDILMRRYITDRTRVFDLYLHPYFTHTAFYIGDDKIVEAIGTEDNPKDEIQIATLSRSDWLDRDIERLIVIKPDYKSKIDGLEHDKLSHVRSSLIQIANDDDYRFGVYGEKRTTCAEMIYRQVFDDKSQNKTIITPDYLFNKLLIDP